MWLGKRNVCNSASMRSVFVATGASLVMALLGAAGLFAAGVVGGSAILRDQTFGPTLAGYNQETSAQTSLTNTIALKASGVYSACGSVGPSMLVIQATAAGNLDFANWNAPQGLVILTLRDGEACQSVATQSDQKTMVGGFSFLASDSLTSMLIARFTTAGALDSSLFGVPHGYVLIDAPTIDGSTPASYVWQIKIQPADQFTVICAFATVGGIQQIVLSRIDTTGALDNGFASGGQIAWQLGDTMMPLGVVVQSDGAIVTGAGITSAGLPQIGLIRYTTAGILDTTYGAGAGYIQYASLSSTATVAGLDIQYVGSNTDKVIVAASSATTNQLWVLRFNTDGSIDTTFGSAGVVTVNLGLNSSPQVMFVNVATDGTDSILISGFYSGPGTSFLIKLSSSGATDATFGDNPGLPTATPGLLTVTEIVPGNANMLYSAIWDLNGSPITAGVSNSNIQSSVIQRYLPNNAQFITLISPIAGQPSTTNPQVFVNGVCSQSDALINILVDDVLTFQTYSDKRGHWEAGLTAPLASGGHTITANLIYDVSTIIVTASATVTIS